MIFRGEDTDNEHSDDITKKNTTDKMSKDVKLVTLAMLLDKAKEKGVSEAQILARINNNIPDKEKIDDIKILSC